MSTTHVGKVGRLPKCIRDMLGQRLEDGEPGKALVKWLNGLPGVQRILTEQFGGRDITEQNLSEWKQGGHQEWLRQEQARSLVSNLTEQAEDLGEASNGQEISDLYASVLAVELAQLAAARLENETDPEKLWQCLREVHRELSQLRRDDHRAVRTMIKRQRWNRELENEEDEAEKRVKQESKERFRSRAFSALQRKSMAELYGGGEGGELIAEILHRIEFDMPLDGLFFPGSSKIPASDDIKPNPTECDLIQPK